MPKSFEEYWYVESITWVRYALLFALACAALIGLSDTAVYDEVTAERVFWHRYLIIVPACLIVVFIAYSSHSSYVFPAAACLCVIVNLEFMLVLGLQDKPETKATFLGSTVQTFLFLFYLFRVPFRMAMFAGLIILASFLGPLLWIGGDRSHTYATWGAIAFAMLAYVCWSRERQSRKLFETLSALERSNQDVRQERSARLQVLQDLTRYLGHEIRTLVEISRLSLSVKADPQRDERIQHSLDAIANIVGEATEAGSLSQALQSESKECVDLATCVDTAIPAVARGRLTLSVPTGLNVMGNQARLIQLFAALFKNAKSYADPASDLRISGSVLGDAATVTVENEGPPLPEPIEVLFNPWHSSRALGTDGHMGLGLFVAKTIVEDHNGRLNAEHRHGKTRFIVSIPTYGSRQR